MSNGKRVGMRIKILKMGAKREVIERIVEKFGLNIRYMTVNGETEVSVKEEDMELFEETARRGFLSILKRRENGEDSVCNTCSKKLTL